MSEAKPGAPQGFERPLSDSSTEVASFDTHERTLVDRIQHTLHATVGKAARALLRRSDLVFVDLLDQGGATNIE